MRAVVCADAHLDSFFPMFNKNDERALLRQEEQRIAFLKAIDEVKRIDAHILIIPGDLFCADRVSHKTIFFLKKTFASIKNTYVLITPGNNDPAVSGSPYLAQDWSENVYIFKNGLEALEFNFDDTNESVRIYGVGFQNHTSKKTLFEKTPLLDQEYLNLFISHGQVCDKNEHSNYNPLYKEDLNACGFDLCLLGHVHSNTGIVHLDNTNYLYTGPCEGRNFNETGRCGIYSGSISKDFISLDFVSTSVRENIAVNIDISNMNDEEDVIKEIKQKCSNKDNLYKVTLTGSPSIEKNFSMSKISEAFASDYFYIKIIPAYKKNVDINLLKKENSLRGCFVSCMEKTANESDNKNKEVYYDALIYGLCALEKEVFSDENS